MVACTGKRIRYHNHHYYSLVVVGVVVGYDGWLTQN